jgi:hypothetical protein
MCSDKKGEKSETDKRVNNVALQVKKKKVGVDQSDSSKGMEKG